MWPPEPRRQFIREDTSIEKQAASQPTCVPPVEREAATEQSNPGTDGAGDATEPVDLVAGAVGEVEPERRRRVTERDGSIYIDLSVPPDDDDEEFG